MAEIQSLETMLRRAAGGDEGAWRTLVEAYTPRLFGLIRSMCANTDLAEEITQSTWCTVAAKLDAYDELGRFEPWLFRIATNRLRDEMRRRKRQARPVEEETLAGLAGTDHADPGPLPVEQDAESRALWAAVAQLSEADRRIIHLRHHADLSFKQIAEILEQPLGTVLARQHRALRKLRDILGQAPGD